MYRQVGKLLLGGILLVKAAGAFALYDGFYSGLELGYSNSGYSKNNVTVDIPELSLTDIAIGDTIPNFPGSVPVETDEDYLGARLYMGYKFEKMFALEWGYTRYADVVFTHIFGINSSSMLKITDNNLTIDLLGANTRVETQSIDLLGKIFIPILNLFDVFLEYGYAYVDINTPKTVDVIITDTFNPPSLNIRLKSQRTHEQKLLAKYGVGVGYNFADRAAIDLVYSQVNGKDQWQSSSLTAINFTLSFG